MKILKIELQNINSIKCDKPITIDFEADDFKDVGLYAITGPTGAGKTTILDAITIALYNKVPRFKITGKNSLRDVVSYEAKEAFTRVTFKAQEYIYEVSWSIRLASSNGKWLSNPQENVSLKNLSLNTILGEQKREVQKKVEEVTQLNYEQFLRSVMLAQGEFASFLSASSKEKGALLEQITGEAIYKEIGEAINKRHYEERKKLQELQNKINTEDVLSTEKLKELKGAITTNNKTLEDLEKELTLYNAYTEWYKKDSENKESLTQLNKDLEKLNYHYESRQPQLKALELHKKAIPFKETITNLNRLEKGISDKESEIKKQEIVIANINSEILKSTRLQKEASEKSINAEKILLEWIPKLDTVTTLDTEIKTEKETLTELVETQKTNDKKLLETSNTFKENQDKLSNVKEKIDSVKKTLDTLKHVPLIKPHVSEWSTNLSLRNKSIDSINEIKNSVTNDQQALVNLEKDLKEKKEKQKELTDKVKIKTEKEAQLEKELKNLNYDKLIENSNKLNAEKTTWEKAKALNNTLNKTIKEEEDILKAQKRNNTEITSIKAAITENTKAILLMEKSVDDAETILRLKQSIVDLKEYRNKLVENEPCQLCGSTHHPSVTEYNKEDTSDYEKELIARKADLQLLNATKLSLSNTYSSINSKLEEINKQLANLKVEKEEIIKEINSLNLSESIINNQVILNAITKLNNALDTIKESVKTAQSISANLETVEKEREQLTALLNAVNIEISGNSESIKNLDNQIKKQTNTIKEQEVFINSKDAALTKSLSEFNIKTPDANSTSAFINELNTAINRFDTETLTNNNLQKELIGLEASVKNNTAQIDTITKEIKSTVTTINSKEKLITTKTEERIKVLPIDITVNFKRNELQQSAHIIKGNLEQVKTTLNELNTKLTAANTFVKTNKETIDKDTIEVAKHKEIFSSLIANSDFNSQQEIEGYLLSNEDKDTYEDISERLKNQKIKLETQTEELNKFRIKLDTEKTFTQSLEEIKTKNETFKTTKKELLNKEGEIKQRIEQDKIFKSRNVALYNTITTQEKKTKVWDDLMKLLGGSKDAFNTYVQRLTLQQLIKLANVHLYKLNDRYSLKMNSEFSKNQELNFNLIDHYQTDQERAIETASGGEKFLISLSLALGLSDLASKNVNIDSLFIDEGFGTLDSRTLELVITTLSALQAQGKMIGVISHVESLKERIPTQIQISKRNNGVSSIEIVQ